MADKGTGGSCEARTTFDAKSATIAIRVLEPAEIERLLKERGVVASARGDVIRIAPHFFTTTKDIDRALDELRSTLKGLL